MEKLPENLDPDELKRSAEKIESSTLPPPEILSETVTGQQKRVEFEALSGWKTLTEARSETNISTKEFSELTGPILEQHPEWAKAYRGGHTRIGKKASSSNIYYSPDLIEMVRNEIDPQPGEGWMDLYDLREAFDFDSEEEFDDVVTEIEKEHEEWVKRSRYHTFYAPAVFGLLKEKFSKRKEEPIPQPPEGWMGYEQLANFLEMQGGAIQRRIYSLVKPYRETHPEWFETHRMKKGRAIIAEYYSPQLVEQISIDFEVQIAEMKEKGPPPGWMPVFLLVRKIKVPAVALREYAGRILKDHPDWSGKFLVGERGLVECYSPNLIEILNGQITDQEPSEDWIDKYEIRKLIAPHSFSEEKVKIAFDDIERLHPNWSKVCVEKSQVKEAGSLSHRQYSFMEYYLPEFGAALLEAVYDKAPEGWKNANMLAEDLDIEESDLKRFIRPFKAEHSAWFAMYRESYGKTYEYYSPELVQKIESHFEEREKKIEGLKETVHRITIKSRFSDFVQELTQSESLEAQEFKKLVTLFGGSKVVDILYKFRPEFKGLPVEYVRSVLANYIGDFLVLQHGIISGNLDFAIKYLGETTLKEGLSEVIKSSCLEYYHQRKKTNPAEADDRIIAEYIEKLRQDSAALQDDNLNSIVDDVEKYYLGVLSLVKPEKFVDEVKAGREFPDLNQRINIKEIADKKKILIADEMGLGKSASAILAKETLGVKQALIVAPSNVIGTWQDYLQNYFKPDEQPSVLTVESVDSLTGDLSGYDYVLISHERLNDENIENLLTLDTGMLIVDEVHKLKNLKEGVRAQGLLKLAEQIKGEDKYMALLSGTPVPNKVEDVAMILKLLYPEQFEKLDSKDMVENIIRGDLVDLRSLLIPRMQMKSLRESVEMPQYIENPPTQVELSEIEKDVYEVLLEEDELTATQKIQILRRFLLNPDLLDSTPGIESSKAVELQHSLIEDFKTHDKIVVFVNGYVEGVIRGENSLLDKLELSDDVEVMVIEGNVDRERREEIQTEVNASRKKILLMVSGQTADVGVDFSGGDMIYFYNEPWTKYDQAQQLARVYRPGLKHDLQSRTFIAKNTIEEGIHKYIEIKQRSIEKLLRGVPLTELEQELLRKNEDQKSYNLEVNPELAEYYFNSWDRLMKIFSEVKEIGEGNFIEYLEEYGREYAEAYLDLGSRSYQSNGGRIVGTVIDELIAEEKRKDEVKDLNILDIASGPEILKRHIGDGYKDRVISMDINRWHFQHEGSKDVVGGFGSLPFREKSMDYANLSLALHYTKLIPSRGEFERVGVLMEMNRVLKEGGKATINLIYSLKLKDEENFKKAVEALGFRIIDDYSGEVNRGSHYQSTLITLEKVKDVSFDLSQASEILGKATLNGLKFAKSGFSLKDTRRVVEGFKIGNTEHVVRFNEEDRQVLDEEKSILEEGKYMKERWGKIKEIPATTVIERGFVRFFDGSKYILFKKLKQAGGIVIIK